MKKELQSDNFPFQEGQGELFPRPPSQRGHRNRQPPLVIHLQTLEGGAAPFFSWVTWGRGSGLAH